MTVGAIVVLAILWILKGLVSRADVKSEARAELEVEAQREARRSISKAREVETDAEQKHRQSGAASYESDLFRD